MEETAVQTTPSLEDSVLQPQVATSNSIQSEVAICVDDQNVAIHPVECSKSNTQQVALENLEAAGFDVKIRAPVLEEVAMTKVLPQVPPLPTERSSSLLATAQVETEGI
ncbi:unnamed protein product [Dibothriocephalus latus]|uniref:Uncharacterized protein n=1 Tax=Dibothriocephalus latus TaxID=60516 RepID=A0A3P7P6L7_DIBLA|nr:unnamed protein product [Dibothriocephalus latus]